MDREKTAAEKEQAWFQGKAFAMGEADREFQEIARRFYCGQVLAHGRLTPGQKGLIAVTALAVGGSQRIGEYALAAIQMGAKTEEVRETLYQCAPYIGLEQVRQALDCVREAFRAAGVPEEETPGSTVTEETRLEKGLAVQQALFGRENIDAMRAAAPEELRHIQEYLTTWCFGDHYTREGLDLSFRELVTFCAICCLGGCEPQAKAHAAANLAIGNDRDVLIEAVTQCLPFIGFPRTLNAIGCINEVTGRG